MKKSVLYLMTVLCTLSFFTACSDDDDNSGKGGWEGLSKTYEGPNQLALKLGETTLALDTKSVVVQASSATQASLTLNNIIPEDAALQMDAALKEADGNYTLSGEKTIGQCKVSVQGVFEKGILSLVIHRDVSYPVTGVWNLKMTAGANGSKVASVYTRIVTGNAQIDALLGGLAGPMIGQLIGQKVESVTVDLSKEGIFGVSWKPVGADAPVDLLSVVGKALSIQYCVIDGKLMIAIDKAYISLLSIFDEKLAQYNLKIEDFTKLMVDLGGYYALPIDMKIEGNDATFYLTKSTIVPVVQMIAPIITPMIPEQYQSYIPTILALLPNMQTLDFGLVFTK